MEAKDLTMARVYVGTYKKYVNGSIGGKWLNLADYANRGEFVKACAMAHGDERNPEFMFQDWENIPEGLIDECFIPERLFDAIGAAKHMDEDAREAFFVWLENFADTSNAKDAEELADDFRDEFQGVYTSEEDFAVEMVETCHELSGFAEMYFDYAAFARDLFICEYRWVAPFVFRAC